MNTHKFPAALQNAFVSEGKYSAVFKDVGSIDFVKAFVDDSNPEWITLYGVLSIVDTQSWCVDENEHGEFLRADIDVKLKNLVACWERADG